MKRVSCSPSPTVYAWSGHDNVEEDRLAFAIVAVLVSVAGFALAITAVPMTSLPMRERRVTGSHKTRRRGPSTS